MSDDKVFNLDKFRLQWADFVARKKELREHQAFVKEAGELLKVLAAGAKEFRLGGEKVATVVAGQLNKSLLAKEQPYVIKRYTKVIAVERFDEAEFKEQEPELYQQYQAQRLVLSGDTE